MAVRTKSKEAPLKKNQPVFHIPMRHLPLFDHAPQGLSWAQAIQLAKAVGDEDGNRSTVAEAPSNQSVNRGRKEHPFDMELARKLKTTNTHHSSCIETKRDSTTGLGFKNETVAKVLDPLCEISFLDVLNRVAEDYWETGNGYLEVVRKGTGPNSPVTGLHHLQAPQVFVYIEDDIYNYHYEIDSEEGRRIKFARFGDLARAGSFVQGNSQTRISEVVHFRRPTSLSRWYGYPDWISAVACIELTMAILQHNYDFFKNFGVPDFLLFLLGAKLDDADWNTVQNLMMQQVGLGNRHKSLSLNLPDPNLKVQLERMRVEELEGSFQTMLDTLSLKVVSAHRVPPLLAGIQIPGKLGANNELPNALMLFQQLVIGQAQTAFQTTLGNTLGNRAFNGSLGLRTKHFEFKRITDVIDLAQMAAVGASRTPVGGNPDAEGSSSQSVRSGA